MKLEVIKPYTRTYENPIAFSRGEHLRVGKPDEDNPEWLWCVASDAREGWVHDSFLALDPDSPFATAARDYTALELSVLVGEMLEGIECVGGWRFARAASGETGWVPAENLRVLE